MQGKQNTPEQKMEPPKAPENNKATVKVEQKPAVSISKFKHDDKILGQIGYVSQRDPLSFSLLVHQIENGLRTFVLIVSVQLCCASHVRAARESLRGLQEEKCHAKVCKQIWCPRPKVKKEVKVGDS